MKVVKTSFVIALFVTLYGCASSPLPEPRGPVAYTPVSPCIESPLLAHAEELTYTDPQTNYVRLLEKNHVAWVR